MRWTFFALFIFAFFAWDVAADNGYYTHLIAHQINEAREQLGLR